MMRIILRNSFASTILFGLSPALALAQGAAQPPSTNLAKPASRTGPLLLNVQDSPEGIAPLLNQNTPGQELRPSDVSAATVPIRTGLFPAFGNILLNNGVEFHGAIVDHFLANPSAGNTPGYGSNLLIFRPSVDFDLGKILGLNGAIIHTSATFWLSKNDIPNLVAQTGGFLTGYQATPILQTSALTKLTYEQRLLSDRLSIEVGRANVHQYFFTPNSIDIFNADTPVLGVSADFNSFPFAPYMGKATYHVTPFWYVQGGAFEDDYRDEVKGAWRFGDERASGVQLLAELGYRSEFSNAQNPANLEMGFEWNTRSGYSNVKGGNANASAANTAANYPGGGVIFWQGAKVVYQAPGPDTIYAPPKNIQLYGQADVAVDQPQPATLDLTAGVNFTGFVPYRPADIFELQARGLKLSSQEAAFEGLVHTRLNHGIPVRQSKDAEVFKAAYQVTIWHSASLTAYGQYFLHPDDLSVPYVNHVPHSGTMVGVFLRLPLGPILGTSNLPF